MEESKDSCESTEPTSPGGQSARSAAPVRPGLVLIFPNTQNGTPVWQVRGAQNLGRSSECPIRLQDASVSRIHACLERSPTGLHVRDLDSSHGTFIDGRRVGPEGAVAAYGSVIRIGSSLLLVAEDVSAYSAPLRRIAGEFLGLPRDMIAGPELRAVWQQAALVAPLSHPVLILGESGSGKEAVARLIHAMHEPPGPFVALNLAAIPEGLFESELFGHARGAFTGASSARAGAFSRASDGVLFVDEVADLRADLQVKLLRALDEMRVRPVGGDEDLQVNVRLIAATSQDLRSACSAGRFREDLYYRLAGIVLRVPALHERRADILALANAFLRQENPNMCFSVRAAEALALARWRGNVRELNYAIARASVQAAASSTREILFEHLPELDTFDNPGGGQIAAERLEAALLAYGNAQRAAKSLGISRSTFYNLLKRYGLSPELIRNGK